MKLNKILVLFAVALPISVVLRLFQILYATDIATGFFKREGATAGILTLCLIGFACAALAVFSHFSFRTPVIRKKSVLQAIPSLLCALTLAYELVTESFAGTVQAWQQTLLAVAGIAAILVFLLHGASLLTGFSLPEIVFLVPPLYFVVRIICAFTAISSLTLISDHVVLMAVYCAGLLFFLNLGKLRNGVGPEGTFRKLLGAGLCFVLLAATESLPYLILNFALKKEYLHTTLAANLSILSFGIFAAAFLAVSFFGKAAEE